MFLENLLQQQLSPSVHNMLLLIISQLNLLLCLVNDVLDIKMIEQEQYQSKMEPFEPKKTLDFIVAMFSPQAEMQKTTIYVETISAEESIRAASHNFQIDELLPTEPLPEALIGDQIRLKQILINLVKNALKFTRKGVIRVIASYDEDCHLFKVHIVDNGKGIKADDMDKLFT